MTRVIQLQLGLLCKKIRFQGAHRSEVAARVGSRCSLYLCLPCRADQLRKLRHQRCLRRERHRLRILERRRARHLIRRRRLARPQSRPRLDRQLQRQQ